MLFLLSVITFIDRVCISLAGPRMQQELHMSPNQWGWVVGAFAIAYAAFEIPSGAIGDRVGPRKVLTRIVLWWSVFTSFTGLARNYIELLPVRFLFGAGEAGAYPNMAASISRWFPLDERARARTGLDGQPRGGCGFSIPGNSHPDGVWLARLLLLLWFPGSDLGRCVAHLVSRLSGAEAGGEPG
jgi:MFS family permease